MKDKIREIINQLDLSKHIEGGYYKRTYQSTTEVAINGHIRPLSTAIYYLLESHDFSCWHRLTSDEMWHHYAGSDVIIYQINAQGDLIVMQLGDIVSNPDARPQYLIPANTWFAVVVKAPDSFTLVGCTVTPGFDFLDFEMGDRTDLLQQYPEHAELIIKLTRES